jgi:hypothetical protein
MSMVSLKRPLAVVLASLLVAAQADAAVVVNEQFEGSWYNPAQSGRGVLADWVPTGAGSGVYFLALFTFDTAGQPLWLTAQVPLTDREFSKQGVDVFKFTGGNFGNTFTAPTGAPIGKLNFEALSCNRIKLDITPNQGVQLPVSNLDLQHIGPAPAGCAYSSEFTTCPAGTTAFQNLPRTCLLPQTISGNLHLPNNATYIISGKTQVGSGRNAGVGVLTIEPGTQLQGSGGAVDYLVVHAGSKIFANGTPAAPVVFTAPRDVPGDWAGLVIAGNAVNNGCVGGTPCSFEADTEVKFGGRDNPNPAGNLISDNADSSGALRYTQIRYAGKEIRANEELNALTLLGVGNGTVIDHVQVHAGKDDGFEMFGGSVNLRYVVGTAVEDDCLDFAEGYTGKIQFAYCKQTATASADSNGLESDNKPNAFDLLPRTQPTLANATFIGSATGNEGLRIRRGSGGNFFNIVASGFAQECLNFNDAATFTASGTAASPAATGVLTMKSSALGCTNNFEDSASEPFLVSAWYRGQAGNTDGAAAALGLSGRFPSANSILLGTGTAVPNDGFFEAVPFKGAFEGAHADWTQGWSYAVD